MFLCLVLCLIIMVHIISKRKTFPSNVQLRTPKQKRYYLPSKKKDMASEAEVTLQLVGSEVACWRIKKIKLYKKPGIYLFGKVERKRKSCLSDLITVSLWSTYVVIEKINAVLTDVKWIFCSRANLFIQVIYMISPRILYSILPLLTRGKKHWYRKKIIRAIERCLNKEREIFKTRKETCGGITERSGLH